jgi:hypothetical protein
MGSLKTATSGGGIETTDPSPRIDGRFSVKCMSIWVRQFVRCAGAQYASSGLQAKCFALQIRLVLESRRTMLYR